LYSLTHTRTHTHTHSHAHAHTNTHTHTHDGTNCFSDAVENFSELNTSQIKDDCVHTVCIYRVYIQGVSKVVGLTSELVLRMKIKKKRPYRFMSRN